MKKIIFVLIAASVFLTQVALGSLAFSISDKGYRKYDTSLELVKSFSDYIVIISEDGTSWEYLQEADGISCGRHFASLALEGENKDLYFSLARKLPNSYDYLIKKVTGIKPMAEPIQKQIKARSTNFLTLAFNPAGNENTVLGISPPSGSLNFRLLSDGDEDGLPDDSEYEKYGAWPGLNDTDQDGLSDGEEVSLGLFPYMADSDGDGITDSLDAHPLIPEYELSFSAWQAYWSAVASIFQISIPENRLSKENYNNRVCPFFDHHGTTVKFTPENLALLNGVSETNVFEVSFISSGIVTGLVYTSDCFVLDYKNAQFLPEDKFPSAPERTVGLPFLARPGETLRFILISDKDWEESGQVMIKTKDGTLPTLLQVNYASPLPPRPALTAPENNAEHSGPFTFSWTCEDNLVTNYVLTITGPVFYEYSLGEENLLFAPEMKGRYFWQVSAQSANGQISSEMRSFFILDNDSEKDSDGDGFPDNEELREGFDPFDKNDAPMRFVPNLLPVGEKGLFYFKQLNVSGGARPLFWKMNEVSTHGLSVNEKGMLLGIPLQVGSFSLSFSVKDQLDRVFNFSLPLEVSEKGTISILPGLGCFLVQ